MTNGHWRGWARRKMSRECDVMWKTNHYHGPHHPFTAPGWVIVGVAAACVMTGMLVGGWRMRSIWWHLSAWVAPLLQTILFINSIILIFINTNMLLMSTKCCSFTKDSICLWQHQPEPALSWGNPLWYLFNPIKLHQPDHHLCQRSHVFVSPRKAAVVCVDCWCLFNSLWFTKLLLLGGGDTVAMLKMKR